MLNPFIDVISMLIGFLQTGLFVWIILSLLIQFNIVNAHQPLVSQVRHFLDRVFNPLLNPIRRHLPDLGGVDLSPLVLILIFHFIESALVHWL